MTNSVELGAQLEAVVAHLVKRGRYNSKSEVLREGVRLVQEREAKLAALDAALARGAADPASCHTGPVDEVLGSAKKKPRFHGRRRDRS